MKQRVLLDETKRKNVKKDQLDIYVNKLKKMIDCKTVYTNDFKYKDEYIKFNNVIKELFPNLVSKAEKLVFGSGCFVYVIKGKNAKKNVMIMSHHDVVDGGEGWDSHPFSSIIKDGYLYGRGTIDTKTPLFAMLQACEELLEEDYMFEDINLYIGSSHNEEVSGDGMLLAVDYFKKNNIHFEVVLDEGGAITSGMIPGITNKSAVVAVHEKSRHMYSCKAVQASKGHGGLNPSKDNVVIRMSQFINEVSKSKIYEGQFYDEVKATFTSHAPYMSFPLNIVFGHFNIFSPIIKKIMLKSPQTSEMISTSISFTTINAGDQQNPQIKAKEAQTTMFLRCIREDDLYQGLESIKRIADKYHIEVKEIMRDYCKPSDFHARPYKVLEDILNVNFPDVIVAPFLLTAGTDARRFSDVADSILRFAPIDLNQKQFASIHGDNEHIGIENIGQCVCFYKDFINKI